jgi:hypothetical protein
MVQTGWADNKTWYVQYSHLSCTKHGIDCKGPNVDGCKTQIVRVKVGDKLKIGQAVGRVGNTGTCSRGAHLHITLGKTLNAGTSGTVYDIEKFIDEQMAIPKVKICRTCKQEIK